MPQISCVSRSNMEASVAASAAPPAGLWPPSSQSSIPGALVASGPRRRRCIRAGHSARVIAASQAGSGVFEQAQRRQRGAGVLDLVRADQRGARQVEKAGFVLEDQAAAFLPDIPVAPEGEHRGGEAVGLGLDHPGDLGGLRADHDRHAGLDDASLLGGDLFQRLAEVLLMVEADRRDDGQRRALDDVRRVEPAAQAHFQAG